MMMMMEKSWLNYDNETTTIISTVKPAFLTIYTQQFVFCSNEFFWSKNYWWNPKSDNQQHFALNMKQNRWIKLIWKGEKKKFTRIKKNWFVVATICQMFAVSFLFHYRLNHRWFFFHFFFCLTWHNRHANIFFVFAIYKIEFHICDASSSILGIDDDEFFF